MFKSRKSLKIKKITLVVCTVIVLLSFTCGAVYTSGDVNTPRYTSPLRFDFEIFGTTAQLTPTISYASGQTLTYDTQETATQANSVVTSINRTNFSVSTFNTTAIEVAYRLKFDVIESVDSFTLKIVSTDGIYDFIKYGIPLINVPTGYTAFVTTSYWQRFTQSQSYTTAIATDKRTTDSYTADDNIPLLFKEVTVNGVDHDIVGGVIIQDYETVITFTKDTGDTPSQQGGFWLWDTVLDFATDSSFEEAWTGSPERVIDFKEPIYIHCLLDGVASTMEMYQLEMWDVDGYDTIEMWYNLQPDYSVLAYSVGDGSWAAWNSEEAEAYLISEEQMRMWQLTTLSLRGSINENPSYGDWTADEFNRYSTFLSAFETFFYNNTTYYEENPLQTVQTSEGATTYAFTDGDGGMYLRYYADRMLSEEFSATMSDFYGFAYGNGFANGDGGFTRDYSGWLAAAVSGFTSLEIFPNFSIGGVLGVIVSVCLLILFLKFFAGG